MPALGEWSHTGYTQKIHFGTGAIDTVGTVLRDPRSAPRPPCHHRGSRRVAGR